MLDSPVQVMHMLRNGTRVLSYEVFDASTSQQLGVVNLQFSEDTVNGITWIASNSEDSRMRERVVRASLATAEQQGNETLHILSILPDARDFWSRMGVETEEMHDEKVAEGFYILPDGELTFAAYQHARYRDDARAHERADEKAVEAVSVGEDSNETGARNEKDEGGAEVRLSVAPAVKQSVEYVNDTLGHGLQGAHNYSVFTRSLVRNAKALIPSAQAWWAALRAKAVAAMKLQVQVDEIADQFDKLPRAEFEATWRAIDSMVSSGSWGYTPSWKPGVVVNQLQRNDYNAPGVNKTLVDKVLFFGHSALRRQIDAVNQHFRRIVATIQASGAATPAERALFERLADRVKTMEQAARTPERKGIETLPTPLQLASLSL